MDAIHRQHGISDTVRQLLEPHLPGRKGAWGGNARDNRTFINAVFWIVRTNAPWRDLPPGYGDWKIPVAASAGGVTGASGSGYLNCRLMSPAMNG